MSSFSALSDPYLDPTLQPKQELPYVICVEGNIGSGKSTLLTNLSKSGFTVIEEPVTDIWGQYLPQLYQDIKRWGFCFQMEAMDWFRQLQSKKFAQILIRMKQQNGHSLSNTPERRHPIEDEDEFEGEDAAAMTALFESDHKEEESADLLEHLTSGEDEDDDAIHRDQENFSGALNAATPVSSKRRNRQSQRRKSLSPQKQLLESSWVRQSKRVIVVERSALSCITIFAKNLLEQKNMTQWEYSLLARFYSMIAWEPAHILYLRVDPEVAIRRIQRRNRKGESNVDPDLIHGLHEKHELMFVRNEAEVNARRASLDGICASPTQNIIIVDGHNDAESVLKEALIKISRIESRI